MGYSKQAAIGIGWMSGLKIIIRSITFLRLFILARILLPEDFGLFGIAALVLAFLEIFTETGINVFLIQNEDKNVLKKYINTAWVVSIFRGIFMFVLIFLLAEPISQFFNAPESKNLILLISFVPLIKGFINPAVVKFQKGLEFNKEFFLRAMLVIFDASVAIGFAVVYQTAESLAVGIIAAAFIEVIFSLLFIKPVPKFKFDAKKFKNIFSEGKWVTLNGIMGYLTMQGDDAVVAKLLNATQLGFYQVAYKFAILPGTEVTQTISYVTFPTFTKFANDKTRLKRAYLKTLALTAVLSLPIGLVLMIFPRQIILLTVGENWLPAVNSLRILSLFGIIGALVGTKNGLLYALKRQDISARISAIKLITLAIVIFPLVRMYGIDGAAYASLISILIAVPPTIYAITKLLYEK